MNTISKRRIRKIVIFAVLGILALGALLQLKIEPADYCQNLSSQEQKAEASGNNQNSECSGYVVSSFSVKQEENQQKENDDNQVSATVTSQGKGEFSISSASVVSDRLLPVSSEKVSAKKYCMVEIRCDTVVDTGKLTNQAVAKYIPKDGTILAETRVEITDGETAFEVLKRVTREKRIQMEFRNDPLYSGAYIEGINHLYELDGGSGSGWMYKVNGWFPNYGCSRYELQDGDTVEWVYTCELGDDVGGGYAAEGE